MRHYAPRQRVTDLRWDYTCGNSPVGYCKAFDVLWPEEKPASSAFFSDEEYHRWREKAADFRDKYHADGHATSDEACACYKTYLLDQRTTLGSPDKPHALYKCDVCGAFTAGYAQIGGYTRFTLCDDHRTREHLEDLYEVHESWES